MTGWPLPYRDEDRLPILMELLDWVYGSPYKIMIRKKGLNYVGVLEEINYPKKDSQYGQTIGWLTGFKSNGGRKFDITEFEEPRYQKVPVTGELKEGIIDFNNMFVFVARNTEDFSDEPSNFTYEASEKDMEQYLQLSQHCDVQKVSMMDLEEKVDELRFRANRSQTQADTLGRELNKIRARYSEVVQRESDLDAQVKRLLKEVKAQRISLEVDDAKMNMQEMNATEIGEMQGMTPAQLMETAAEKYQGFLQTMNSLMSSGGTQDAYNDFKNTMDVKLEKFMEEVKKIANGKKAVPTVTKEEK